MTPEQLYAALRKLPITDERLRKAAKKYPSIYRIVVEQLRMEGHITRAQAAK